jgi:malonyl CoA-acyl carrier protein transacylase
MRNCVGVIPVAMAAAMPITEAAAREVVHEIHKCLPQDIVDIANINSPKQVVFSGSLSGVRSAVELSKLKYVIP